MSRTHELQSIFVCSKGFTIRFGVGLQGVRPLRAWGSELGRGDAAWLAATRAPSQLKGEDIGQAPEFVAAIFKAGEAVNAMGIVI